MRALFLREGLFELDVGDDEGVVADVVGEGGHGELGFGGLGGAVAVDFLEEDVDSVIAGRDVVDLESEIGSDFEEMIVGEIKIALDWEGPGVDEIVVGVEVGWEDEFSGDGAADAAKSESRGLGGDDVGDADVISEVHGDGAGLFFEISVD
jgi:hypothetical protein